jgi:hypothetical protein
LSKKIPIKVETWSPAHDELMNSPEITQILNELPEESRAAVEEQLKGYVSVLTSVISTMSHLRSTGIKPGDADG